MRFLFWLIVVPLAVFIALFAVNNLAVTQVDFRPFPYQLVMPLYILVIGAVFVGLFVGGVATWIGQHHWRKQARTLHRRVKHLEGEIEAFRSRTVPPGGTPPAQRVVGGG